MVRVMNVQRQASGAEPTGRIRCRPPVSPGIRRKVTEILEEAENLRLMRSNPSSKPKAFVSLNTLCAMNAAQKKEMNRYFDEDIFPVLTPPGR